jgi:predicted phosphodiesterase
VLLAAHGDFLHMAVFNIIHLTDLHFASVPDRANIFSDASIRAKLSGLLQGDSFVPSTHDPQIAEGVAAWLYRQRAALEQAGDALDALILSGDLATTGLRDDLDPAFDYVDTAPTNNYYRDARGGEQRVGAHLATIADPSKPCFIVPGNHDRFKNNGCRSGGKLFDTVFDKYWARQTNGVVASILTKLNAAGEEERLAIIGVDGCLRRRSDATSIVHEMSQGYFYIDALDALRDKTEAARRMYPDIAVVWVVHFPPHHTVSLMETMRDGGFMWAESRNINPNVSMILSGHTHQNQVFPAGAGCTIWNGGSVTQCAEKRGNWLQYLEIEVLGNRFVRATRQNYKWKTVNDETDYHLETTDLL